MYDLIVLKLLIKLAALRLSFLKLLVKLGGLCLAIMKLLLKLTAERLTAEQLLLKLCTSFLNSLTPRFCCLQLLLQLNCFSLQYVHSLASRPYQALRQS